jgi:hypothetical protein
METLVMSMSVSPLKNDGNGKSDRQPHVYRAPKQTDRSCSPLSDRRAKGSHFVLLLSTVARQDRMSRSLW